MATVGTVSDICGIHKFLKLTSEVHSAVDSEQAAHGPTTLKGGLDGK